jgi:hypothetical protein
MGKVVEDWWIGRPGLDSWVPIIVTTVHWVLYRLVQTPPLLESLDRTSRPALYGASALVVSLTGTLASLTVGQYLGASGDRVQSLKKHFPDVLGRTWRGAYLRSGLAAVLLLTAYALDNRRAGGTVGMWVFEIAALLAIFCFVRLAILFGRVITVVVLDDIAPLTPSTQGINMQAFTKNP